MDEKELAKKAVGKLVMFMTVKWTIIIVGTRLARRALK